MPAAVDDLVVICLGRGNVAQAGPAAHHVHQHHGHFGAGNVGKTFHHQADAGAGGGGHDARAGAGRAVDHVDGAKLAFSLDEGTPQFGHAPGHVFKQFGLRGDGVAKIGLHARPHRGFGDGFVALP